MTAWYQHYKSLFTPEECQSIIDYGSQFPVKEGKVGHGGDCHISPIRSSKVRWLQRDDANLQFVFDRLVLRCLRVNQDCFRFQLSNYPELSFEHAQFTEYHADTEDHYEWHEDNTWVPKVHTEEDRKISCIVQLSQQDAYKGGVLELERAQLRKEHFTDQGDTLFIPSFLRHRVTNVSEGIRYSLVIWFKGKRFS